MAAASSSPSALRPLYAAVGALAAAALLWFVGPLVAVAGVSPLAGEPARWAAIGALVFVVVGNEAWRAGRRMLRRRRLIQGLVEHAQVPVPGAAAGEGAEEVAVIGERFERAVQLLQRSRVGGRHRWLAALSGRPFIYELPWYIIIGAPGAGKTTALVNSGLHFPLESELGKASVRGIGGTRNCDWWFTSQAVLVDTAGRYTTHESNRAADREAWFGFLDLLARFRPRQPINGVLLTISASDLLSGTPQWHQAHAATLRERIDELHQRLGLAFPIYVLVTKTDLLAGFMEFFADYDKDERAQVWGTTFAYPPGASGEAPIARIASEFAALEKRLNDSLIERLQNERDHDRCAVLYAFPQQWHVLRQALFDVLQPMLSQLRPELQPMIRGVYFTSATQEGSPMDRVLGAMARSLGLANRVIPAARPSGKTFFVTRLLRDVVFAESGLAGANLAWRRRRRMLTLVVGGLTLTTVVVLSALAWRAYEHSGSQVQAMEQPLNTLDGAVAAARAAAPGDVVAMLPALDALAALAGGADAAADQSTSALTLGLDRRETLADTARDAYERTLREGFLPRIATRLEQRLRAGEREHVELIYETLKAYLMLFGGRNFDAAALRAYLHADWEASLPASVKPAQREALRRHLDHLLATGEVGAPSAADPGLIAAARSLVGSVPLAQRAYLRLKQTEPGGGAAPFTAESAAGAAAAQRVFVRASGKPLNQGVPALYTRAVWQGTLPTRVQGALNQLAAEEGWVLGAARAAAPTPAAQAALVEEVQRLYMADYVAQWSDLLGDLRVKPTADLAATADMAQLLAKPDSPLLAVLRGALREVSLDSGTLAGRFDELQRYLAGQPAAADELRTLLGKLSTQLVAVEDAAKRKSMPPASAVVTELQAAAQRAPQPLRGWVLPLAAAAEAQALAALREPLGARLAGELAPACGRLFTGRYPLNRSAAEDMPREDFAQAFGGGGTIDELLLRPLAPYAVAASGNAGVLSAETLSQFHRAGAIREAFFADGGRQLAVRMEWRLLELDAGVSEFVLDMDGQALRFRRGGGAQRTQWPGANGAGRVQLQLVSAAGAAGAVYAFQGPWGLLHLLDRVRVDIGPTPERAQLLFDVEGRKARFELRSSAPLAPLVGRELEQFRCPTRL